MFKNQSCTRLLSLLIGCILLISGCGFLQKGSKISEGDPVMSSIGKVINLEQGWSVDIQQAFYFTSQGSRIMPYSWFLVLEQANNNILFRNNEHIELLRYLPSKPNNWNPDGLPCRRFKSRGG